MTTQEALKRLEEFSSLEDNWDSYGGMKPTEQSIAKTVALIKTLFVCPNAENGGMTITLGLGMEEEIGIEISPNGAVAGPASLRGDKRNE